MNHRHTWASSRGCPSRDGAAFTADQVATFRGVQDPNWTPWIFGDPTAGTKQAVTNVSSSLLSKIEAFTYTLAYGRKERGYKCRLSPIMGRRDVDAG